MRGHVANEDARPRRTARSATCGIGAPGVGAIMPAQVIPQRRRRRRPQPNAPSTWSHVPGRVATASRDRVEGSKAPVLTSPACAHTIVGPRQSARSPQLRGAHRAPRRRRRRGRPPPPEPDQPERDHHRGVDVLADDDVDRRRADRAHPLRRPSRRPQDRMAGRGERREIGHRGPGREADRRPSRQPEQVDQPVGGHLLDDRRRGGPEEQADVLVPGRVNQSAAPAPPARSRR